VDEDVVTVVEKDEDAEKERVVVVVAVVTWKVVRKHHNNICDDGDSVEISAPPNTFLSPIAQTPSKFTHPFNQQSAQRLDMEYFYPLSR